MKRSKMTDVKKKVFSFNFKNIESTYKVMLEEIKENNIVKEQ